MAQPLTRTRRLGRLAQQLSATTPPYYLDAPRARAEPAPGWYWVPPGQQWPAYLGANAVRAEWTLTDLLLEQHAPRTPQHQ